MRDLSVRSIGTNRWEATWRIPADHGGWKIKQYDIGDIDDKSGRDCTTNPRFPLRRVRPQHAGQENLSVRFMMYRPLTNTLGDRWDLAVRAVNAKGRGACVSAAP